MLDDIGLGSAIAKSIYATLFLIGGGGMWFCIKNKNIIGTFFCPSLILNLFFYLYFMGNYVFYPKYFYPIINSYWPWINLGLFVLLIANYIRSKKNKR